MKEAYTIRDVARLAGVSAATASQVLNNKGNISPETRAKVLDSVAQLGYQHQSRAASPALKTVGMLAIRFDLRTMKRIDLFYSYVLAGVERECQRQKFDLMYASLEVDEHLVPLEVPSMIQNKKVDGLLIVGAWLSDDFVRACQQSGKAIILVDAYADSKPFDSISTDNIDGAYNAVSYLIQQGHTRIGLIGSSPDSFPSLRDRRDGYRRALADHGISDVYIENSTPASEAAYEATRQLLQRAPEVTAIFAVNDPTALVSMRAIRDMGLTIPHDISIVGFDDVDTAQEVRPALTTIHVDKLLMGALAVRQLGDRARHPDRAAVTLTLHTQLIVRETVGAPRRGELTR